MNKQIKVFPNSQCEALLAHRVHIFSTQALLLFAGFTLLLTWATLFAPISLVLLALCMVTSSILFVINVLGTALSIFCLVVLGFIQIILLTLLAAFCAMCGENYIKILLSSVASNSCPDRYRITPYEFRTIIDITYETPISKKKDITPLLKLFLRPFRLLFFLAISACILSCSGCNFTEIIQIYKYFLDIIKIISL